MPFTPPHPKHTIEQTRNIGGIYGGGGHPSFHRRFGITLTVADAETAASFYVRAFGAEEIARYLVPDHPPVVGPVKSVHLRIGAMVVNVSTANPRDAATVDKWGAKTPAMPKGFSAVFTLYVDDMDATLARAVDAGARRVSGLEDTLWGDRVTVIEDPFGHPWGLAKEIEEITVEEHNRRWAELAAKRGKANAPYLKQKV